EEQFADALVIGPQQCCRFLAPRLRADLSGFLLDGFHAAPPSIQPKQATFRPRVLCKRLNPREAMRAARKATGKADTLALHCCRRRFHAANAATPLLSVRGMNVTQNNQQTQGGA